MSSSIASPSISAVTRPRSSAACGTSRPTTAAPSSARVSAIAAPIPREAPVTSAFFPASGSSQSISGTGATPGPMSHDLAGDVGRAWREQEAERRVELLLAALGDVDELSGGAAAADLLGQRAGEALERPLRRRRTGRLRDGRRRGAEHDDAAVALEPADAGVEEALQLDQLGRVGDPRGVEDERLRLALGSRPFDPEPVERRLQRSLQPPAGGRAGEQAAGETRCRRSRGAPDLPAAAGRAGGRRSRRPAR